MRKINCKKSSYKKHIKKTKQYSKKQKGGDGKCMDFISGEELDIEKYMTDNPDNLVFQIDDTHFMCSTREDLKNNVDSNIVYICNKEAEFISGFHNNTAPDGTKIYSEIPYVSTRELGISWGGIVSLENIYKIVLRTTEQLFTYKKTGDASATVSKNVIDNQKSSYRGQPFDMDYMVSAMHCQAGSNRPIFKILTESQTDYEDSEGDKFTPVARSLTSMFDSAIESTEPASSIRNDVLDETLEPVLSFGSNNVNDPAFIEYLKNLHNIAITEEYREQQRRIATSKLVDGINKSIKLLLGSFFRFEFMLNPAMGNKGIYSTETYSMQHFQDSVSNLMSFNLITINENTGDSLDINNPIINDHSKLSLRICISRNVSFDQSRLENIMGRIRDFTASVNDSKDFLIFSHFYTINDVNISYPLTDTDSIFYRYVLNKYSVNPIGYTGQKTTLIMFYKSDGVYDKNFVFNIDNTATAEEVSSAINDVNELKHVVLANNFFFNGNHRVSFMLQRLERTGALLPYDGPIGRMFGGKNKKYTKKHNKKHHKKCDKKHHKKQSKKNR
jgi:hypothetical protein